MKRDITLVQNTPFRKHYAQKLLKHNLLNRSSFTHDACTHIYIFITPLFIKYL